jgi:hypothetical protein
MPLTRSHLLPVAALAALAVPTAAHATQMPKLAWFDVEVDGTMTSSWSTHHTAGEGCDVTIDGSGSETDRFKTRKPVRIEAIWGASGLTFLSKKGRPTIPMTVKIKREGTLTATGTQACSSGDGTGGGPVAAPDCGTKRFSDTVELDDAERLVSLTVPDDRDRDPFANCPAGTFGWPLVEDDDQGRRIGDKLPPAVLFHHGKTVIIKDVRRSAPAENGGATGRIRWTLSFTKVKAHR